MSHGKQISNQDMKATLLCRLQDCNSKGDNLEAQKIIASLFRLHMNCQDHERKHLRLINPNNTETN